MSSEELNPARLKQFRPFETLDESQLLLLCSRMDWKRVPRGHKLFSAGDVDALEYFLLDGEVELKSADGIVHRIDQHHPTARGQLARLRPRQFTAITTRPSEIVVMDADILEGLQEELKAAETEADNYGVSEVSSLEESESQALLIEFRSAVQRNQVKLPSLPEVALKVRKLLEDENSNADVIAAAVNADPAIAAKLMRAANSPIYHGSVICETSRNSIVRLGLVTTRQLVVSFAIRELFSSNSPSMHKYMLKTWRHSVEVAAISFVIARMSRTSGILPEEAMLAGLVHDIGVIAVLAYLDTQAVKRTDEQMDAIIASLRAEVGEMILERWKFPREIITSTRFARDWQRQHPMKADVCDIVQIAKLHSYIRNRQHLPVARIDSVPAFHKLPLGELTPELTINILDEAREQIAAIKQVLSG